MTNNLDSIPIQVVTAADSAYLEYLTCHLASLIKNGSKRNEHVMKITVIHRNLSKGTQKKLKKMIPEPHRLKCVELNKEVLKRIRAPLRFATCSPHYFRLLIPYLLKTCSRAIYLDADTLVLNSLVPLWTTKIDGYMVAAVRDYITHIGQAVENWKELNLDPTAPYFNSGVLLIDLISWRKNKVSEKVLSICQQHKDKLLAQKKWPQYDQYGLNVVLHGKWKELDQIWNYGTDSSPLLKANIIHYIGNGKLGRSTCNPFFSELFYNTLNQNAFHR